MLLISPSARQLRSLQIAQSQWRSAKLWKSTEKHKKRARRQISSQNSHRLTHKQQNWSCFWDTGGNTEKIDPTKLKQNQTQKKRVIVCQDAIITILAILATFDAEIAAKRVKLSGNSGKFFFLDFRRTIENTKFAVRATRRSEIWYVSVFTLHGLSAETFFLQIYCYFRFWRFSVFCWHRCVVFNMLSSSCLIFVWR
jgi:hypothetical protein